MKHHTSSYFFLLFIFFLLKTELLQGFDQSLFYHARYFPGEPRFEKSGLSSIDVKMSGGSTCTKTDESGSPVSSQTSNRYRTDHFIFTAIQNISHGVFFSTTLPIYCIHIEEGSIDYNGNSVNNMNITGGWTVNYEDTQALDFVDLTFETGIILPTAKEPVKSKGIPFRGACAFGIYDWLTYGIQADTVMFFDTNNGRLWDVNFYVKADHFCRGLSILLGYSHSDQTETPIPWSENKLDHWSMDTFHFFISYDSATEKHPYAPRIEFFYNHTMNGKNIIENSLFGFTIGSDF